MWLLLAGGCAVAVGVLFFDLRRQAKQENGPETPKRFRKGMREREYIKLIPQRELRPLQRLLHRIFDARGWCAATDDTAACERAWARVLRRAQSPEGGAWSLNPQVDQASPEQLQALLSHVEQELLGGLLSQHITATQHVAAAHQPPSPSPHAPVPASASKPRPPLRAVLAVDPRDPHGWLSGLHPDNTVYVNRRAAKWRQAVSAASPLDFEGALCRSRLEVLAHTLGHELAHALVLNCFPDIDARSGAYLPDDRHGPIFLLLNRRLFGHTSSATHHMTGGRAAAAAAEAEAEAAAAEAEEAEVQAAMAEAEAAAAEAEAAVAEAEAAEAEAAAAEAEEEAAQAELEAAQAELEVAQAELEAAEAQLEAVVAEAEAEAAAAAAGRAAGGPGAAAA